MIGLGTVLNAAGIVLGGLLGMICGRFLSERIQDTLTKVCGVSSLFLGIAGAMEGMLSVEGGSLSSGGTMVIVGSLALGGLVGELIDIESAFERFGEWLKMKTGNAREQKFVEGFVTASLTVCVGAMAIMGAIEDGISGDWSILGTKAVMDLIIVLAMTCSLGKGCIFSAIPVAVWQGSVTALARFIRPLMTDGALTNLSMVGSVLIFCVGLNLVWGKKVRVANLLPAVVFAAAFSFL